jgi:DNA polymerase-3 subunit delta'
MDFTGFLGNDAVKARLSGAFASGRVAHSYLLCGPAGSGKHTLTRILSAAMQCEGRSGKIPCGICSGCRKALEGVHPDIITVDDPDHKAMTVDPIRAARSDMFIRPNEGARKVYIFEDCTILTEKDQNVLLKLVEEGPAYAAFFFCAENPAVLLQTIRSRCVEVKLFPTVEEGGAPDELTLELARLIADGSRASRAAFLAKLETQKVTRDDLSSLFEGTRLLLSSALLGQYGVSVPERDLRIAQSLASRLTKAKLLGTIDLLQDYRNKCTYNVGVGPTLGGFAVELEETL